MPLFPRCGFRYDRGMDEHVDAQSEIDTDRLSFNRWYVASKWATKSSRNHNMLLAAYRAGLKRARTITLEQFDAGHSEIDADYETCGVSEGNFFDVLAAMGFDVAEAKRGLAEKYERERQERGHKIREYEEARRARLSPEQRAAEDEYRKRLVDIPYGVLSSMMTSPMIGLIEDQIFQSNRTLIGLIGQGLTNEVPTMNEVMSEQSAFQTYHAELNITGLDRLEDDQC